MTLTQHQREQLAIATSGPIGILGGGPGTGKTFAVAHLVSQLSSSVGLDQICLGAPTGKAAVRVTETLQSHGIDLRARTWHSILRGGPSAHGQGFTYGRGNPLPYKVYIGDEESMTDTDMMAARYRALPRDALVLHVGDVYQLPPVGHGRPLFDMIAAGLPYGELTEIHRNSGGIVEACAAIRESRPWQPGDNLRLDECSDPEVQIEVMLGRIRQQAADGLNPIWDCQVVVPVNRKSPLARTTLNEILQRELNPQGQVAGGNPFRIGDKIVNTKNGYFQSIEHDADDPDLETDEDENKVYVANGELGEVLEVAERMTVCKLQNPNRVIRIPRGKQDQTEDTGGSWDDSDGQDDKAPKTGCSWDLGYALSVHKSQGSEWPCVLVMIDAYPGAAMVCSQEWHYTAISRAKQICNLIGQRAVMDQQIRRRVTPRRKTFLKERILIERGKLELEGM